MRKKLLQLCGLLLFTLGPSCALASGEDSAALILKAYDGVTDLSARFSQLTTIETTEIEKTSSGAVFFKRGGKMRWEYEGNDPQLIVSDGKVLWFYQVRDRTAVRRETGKLPPSAKIALDLLGGLRGSEKYFEKSSCGEGCLELTPKKPDPDLKRLLVRHGADGFITSVSTENGLGNVTRVEFSGIKKNTGVKEELFSFTPPEGVEIVDESGEKK
jgi:outer membrane lipoprotein carrier protein